MLRPALVVISSLLLVLFLPTTAIGAGSAPATQDLPADAQDPPRYLLEAGDTFPFPSRGTSEVRVLSKACPDTFALYGGPGSNEGRFQTPQFAPDLQGWTGLDHTDLPNHWQVSTFNAETLGGHGAGNQAMWCGESVEDQPGWATPPGYGNSWSDELRWTSGPLANTDQGQTVDLELFFHHDVEPGYDYFLVQYDSAGFWKTVLSQDGDSRDSTGVFLAPGLQFSELQTAPIEFSGNDYGGEQGDEIVVRLLFQSDFAWSDEDGLWDTEGAVQADDLSVSWTDGGAPMSSVETFEGPGPYVWETPFRPIAGDFVRVFPRFDEIDPCRENDTPVLGFIDDGTSPRNDPFQRTTGGSISPTWSYGIPGGWVVNFTGGVSFGEAPMHNSAVSPPIAWDLPGTCDDDPEVVDLFIRWDHFQHAPYGVLPTYEYRYSTDGAVTWSSWISSGFFWVGSSQWFTEEAPFDIPINVTPTHVQWAFTMWDVADLFGLPSDDSTPASVIDNVAVYKVRVAGPAVSIPSLRRLNDGFPVSGSIAATTQAERDALDIPLFGLIDDPAEFELQANVNAEIPGTSISEVRLFWILEKNPLFDDAIRQAPARPQDENVETSDPLVWRGEVLGTLVDGDDLEGSWSVDLPDSDFVYPGDRLRYYARATDSDSRISTWPRDITGFENGETYNRWHQIRGLPTISDDTGTQPPMLFVLRKQNRSSVYRALDQMGLVRGQDYDLFYMQGTFVNWNLHGIGSAGGHGANADQLEGYSVIVMDTGSLLGSQWPQIGDGVTGNSSNDVEVLTTWRAKPGARHFALLGQHAAQSLLLSSPLQVFLDTVLGASFNDANLRDEVGGQQSPVVQPLHPAFGTTFVASGPCPSEEGFDSITAIGAATIGHGFLSTGGQVVPGLAGSVIHEVDLGGDLKKSVLMPIPLWRMWDLRAKAPGNLPARAIVLGEILDYFGGVTRSGQAVGNPPSERPLLAGVRLFPNPFNPSLTIEFELGRRVPTRVGIYNLRGERIATLVEDEIGPGPQRMVWDGRDTRGASVASGVYLYHIKAEDVVRTGKVALVR